MIAISLKLWESVSAESARYCAVHGLVSTGMESFLSRKGRKHFVKQPTLFIFLVDFGMEFQSFNDSDTKLYLKGPFAMPHLYVDSKVMGWISDYATEDLFEPPSMLLFIDITI